MIIGIQHGALNEGEICIKEFERHDFLLLQLKYSIRSCYTKQEKKNFKKEMKEKFSTTSVF